MKLYSISRILFGGVIVLILLLPVSRHWRLLSFGERVTGTVGEFVLHKVPDMFGENHLEYASKVQFPAGDSLFSTLGPTGYEMKPGKTIPVRYNPEDPSDNLLFNFTCLYYTNYSILPLILIIVWWAFYLSYNNYRRGKRRTR